MSKICPLFSGSSGNSTYIESGKTAILVDIGRSAKQIENAIKANELELSKIKAIFITHEHIDHVKGLRVFASRYNIPVFSSKGTIDALKAAGHTSKEFEYSVISTSGISIESMEIIPFRTSHDCCESLGFVIKTVDDTKVALASDLGFVSSDVRRAINFCDVVVLESNHEVSMLRAGSYPYALKKRILSSIGHLSNDDCAKELPYLVKNGTRHILLSHLSEDNNDENIAYRSALYSLQKNGFEENIDFTLNICPKVNENKLKIFF